MVAEWKSVPDVEYLVASTVQPNLMQILTHASRPFRFFHNFVGLKRDQFVQFYDDNGMHLQIGYEDWIYRLLYPATVRAGSGLNAVTRALDVALYMGFAKIIVLGADCCLQVKKPQPKRMAFG